MDSLARFEKILALLEANPEGLMGSELAEFCGVPWPVIQDDLFTIYYSGQNLPIYSERDGESFERHSEDAMLSPDGRDEDHDEERFRSDERWFIAPRSGNPLIHLTPEDAINLIHLLDFQPQDSTLSRRIKQKLLGHIPLPPNRLFYIKGNMEPLPMDQNLVLKLEAALLRSQTIEILFKGKTSIVDPLGLVYYSRLRTWYLVARHEEVIKTYGLFKLKEVNLSGRRYVYPEDFSLKEWFKPRWGMEYGEGFNIKVRFADRAQTFAKVRKDVAHRQASLREEEGYLIFEDYIIGKNEFIAWLLGFGSAAEILEPPELRQEMKKRLQEAVARYSNKAE